MEKRRKARKPIKGGRLFMKNNQIMVCADYARCLIVSANRDAITIYVRIDTQVYVCSCLFSFYRLLPFVSVRPRRRKNTLSSCIFLRGAIDDVKASKNVLYFANNGSDTLTTMWNIRHQKNIHLSVLSKSEEKESNIFHSSFRHSSILNVIRVIKRANYYLRRSIYAPFYTYVLARRMEEKEEGGGGPRVRGASVRVQFIYSSTCLVLHNVLFSRDKGGRRLGHLNSLTKRLNCNRLIFSIILYCSMIPGFSLSLSSFQRHSCRPL